MMTSAECLFFKFVYYREAETRDPRSGPHVSQGNSPLLRGGGGLGVDEIISENKCV